MQGKPKQFFLTDQRKAKEPKPLLEEEPKPPLEEELKVSKPHDTGHIWHLQLEKGEAANVFLKKEPKR